MTMFDLLVLLYIRTFIALDFYFTDKSIKKLIFVTTGKHQTNFLKNITNLQDFSHQIWLTNIRAKHIFYIFKRLYQIQ